MLFCITSKIQQATWTIWGHMLVGAPNGYPYSRYPSHLDHVDIFKAGIGEGELRDLHPDPFVWFVSVL